MSRENYRKEHPNKPGMPNLPGHKTKNISPRVLKSIENRTDEFRKIFFEEIKPTIITNRKDLDQT